MIPDPALIAEINARWAGIVAPREKKSISRKEVEAAVRKYKAGGGQITELPSPEPQPGARRVIPKQSKYPVVVHA